ncbi:MAG: BrxE family protein, partial [Syntrophales bacterium]|nr:BrxE family protein [Syntrophales bacterium]
MTTDNETQKPTLPLLILRLRAVVLALGESASPAWWKTEFMNETGLRFLERLYPRTTFQAAVHAAGKAA